MGPALVPLLDCNSSYCQHDMNLAGGIFNNNSFLGMVKVHHKVSEVHLVTAADWQLSGKYKQMPNDESGNLFPDLAGSWGLEDPELWKDENGHFHALFHSEQGLDSG